MKIPRSVLVGVALLAIAAGATSLWQSIASRAAAPEMAYTQLDGRQEALQALRGKVVLVNFWATSCTTCVKEMPELVATYEKFKARGYDTVAIAMSYDPPAYVAKFAESRQLPFKVALDSNGGLAQSFGGVQLTPTTFLIDKRGRIVKRYLGAPDFAALHSLIEKLIAEG